MSKEITITTGDLYAEMYEDITGTVSKREIDKNIETVIHQLYQEVESQRAEQTFSTTEADINE